MWSEFSGRTFAFRITPNEALLPRMPPELPCPPSLSKIPQLDFWAVLQNGNQPIRILVT